MQKEYRASQRSRRHPFSARDELGIHDKTGGKIKARFVVQDYNQRFEISKDLLVSSYKVYFEFHETLADSISAKQSG